MNWLKKTIFLVCCTLLLSLWGCQNKLLTVYRIDVQQGNALELEEIEQIELGMNKEQVRFILGSPLIADSFHPDRWDYVYMLIPNYGETKHRQLTIIFDRDEVIDIIKHNIPAASEDSGDDEGGEN